MRRRGSLILALLVLSFLFLICLGYLARQPLSGKAVSAALLETQARNLAECGLEDVRLKLMTDINFPPIAAKDQPMLSYVDEVHDLSGRRVGLFRVTLDQSWAGHPYFVYRISSEGILGEQARPDAVYTVRALFDLAVQKRGGGGANPDFWEWIEWNETS